MLWKLTQASYGKKKLGINLPISRSLSFMIRVMEWAKTCSFILKNLLNGLAYLVPSVHPNFYTTLTQMHGGPFVNFEVH